MRKAESAIAVIHRSCKIDHGRAADVDTYVGLMSPHLLARMSAEDATAGAAEASQAFSADVRLWLSPAAVAIPAQSRKLIELTRRCCR